MTTSIGAPIRPADTVVSPITIPPMIETAWPTAFGKRNPASLIISYKTRSISASVINEYGVVISSLAIVKSIDVGMSSW